jgi:hypothetical protein
MKTLFAVTIFAAAVTLAPIAAVAQQQRGTDAALGAASGFVVGGPVGAAAGAAIGYTAGPAIAAGMGLHRGHYYYDNYGHRHYTYR